MTTPYRASEDDWLNAETMAAHDSGNGYYALRCILELRARVEALEQMAAHQLPRIEARIEALEQRPQDKLDRLIALDAAPTPEAAPVARPEGDWFAVAMMAQDMRSRGLAEQEHGDELLRLAHAQPAAARPANYIDPEHQGEALELLQTFYQACQAEGGTADEIYLRGIRAVLAARPATQPPATQPAPPVAAAALSHALIKAECALSDIAEGEETNAAPSTFEWAEQRCVKALDTIRPVMRDHGIRTSEWPGCGFSPPQPAPPAAPAGGLVERVAGSIWQTCDLGIEARAAIREVAAWLRENEIGFDAAHALGQEADR